MNDFALIVLDKVEDYDEDMVAKMSKVMGVPVMIIDRRTHVLFNDYATDRLMELRDDIDRILNERERETDGR